MNLSFVIMYKIYCAYCLKHRVELYENNDISQNNMKIKIFTGAVCGLFRIMLLRGDAFKKYISLFIQAIQNGILAHGSIT